MAPSLPPSAVRRHPSSNAPQGPSSSISPTLSSSFSPTAPSHPSPTASSPLNPGWAPSSASQLDRSTSGGSHTSSSEYDAHRASAESAGGLSPVGGGGRRDELQGVVHGQIGSAYGPFSYNQMPTAASQQPLLAQGPSNSRFSTAMSDTSLSSSVYNNNSPNQSPYHFSNGDAKRNSAAGSLMGVQAGASTGATTTMLLWDDKDPELDDALHRPDPPGKRRNGFSWSTRGCINMGTVFLLIGALLTLFAGYPIISEYRKNGNSFSARVPTGFNLGGINGTGQVPVIPNLPTMVDKDTPTNVYTRTGFDGFQYNLVFSDEFETDGRTFYPGDDPYWEAVDLHYWPTADFEWYSPRAATTAGGSLVLTMTERESHGLNFESGMLQSWNKACFTGGYLEASVALPGNNKVGGYWPGVWLMGNLGRPGYGGTTDGVWPYSYDSCDVGTFPNQTWVNGSGPVAALTTGYNDATLSYLPGQKLSACTCKGEDHPGPNVGVGRGAPEIDILEGQVDMENELGQMSQSAQCAPFDDSWQFNEAETITYDTAVTKWNGYLGGLYQQAVSGLSYVNSAQSYGGNFNTYGVEYHANKADRSAGFITWQVGGVPTWTMNAAAIGPNAKTEVGQRLVPEEPMSIVLNFGMSNGFQPPDFANLKWPAELKIDYIRVYQRAGEENYGCDPSDYPTADYISKHADVYGNANMTVWADAGLAFPRNSQYDGC